MKDIQLYLLILGLVLVVSLLIPKQREGFADSSPSVIVDISNNNPSITWNGAQVTVTFDKNAKVLNKFVEIKMEGDEQCYNLTDDFNYMIVGFAEDDTGTQAKMKSWLERKGTLRFIMLAHIINNARDDIAKYATDGGHRPTISYNISGREHVLRYNLTERIRAMVNEPPLQAEPYGDEPPDLPVFQLFLEGYDTYEQYEISGNTISPSPLEG